MNKIRLGNKDIYYQVFYKKIKHMYLRVKDDKIIVSCNRRISLKHIEDFIRSNQTRIINSMQQQLNKVPLYSDKTIKIFSESYHLECCYGAKKNHYLIDSNTVKVWFKANDFDKNYIETIYKELTLKEMEQAYRNVYNVISKDISIDNIIFKAQLMKSRFGSCIPKKRVIKLNSILARFDRDYIKIILIHELIHLSVKNHQKEFYRYMMKYIPNYKEIIKALNHETRKYVI